MSYKYAAVQVGPNKYVLPKSGDMSCDVVAFLSPDLYEGSDEEMWRDAAVTAAYPGAKGVYLMPDCHKGYVLPVGGVLVTDNVIAQAGSGFDISCGVVHMRIPGLHARDIADFDQRMKWVRRVEEVISLGAEAPKPVRRVNQKLLSEVFRHGAQALGIRTDLCERASIPVSDHFDEKLIEHALERAAGQLGSVGGGNHFVELQCDVDTGEVWLMVHCGSRSFGWRAADYFFDRCAEEKGLPKSRREEAWVRLDEEIGKLYWAWHNAAANYAVANRHLIAAAISDITDDMFGARGQLYYEISHNLVQHERLLLPDGSVEEGFVHRKGATRAFPAGHPDLAGTAWEKTGHPCLIPGSMLSGAAVLFPRRGATTSGNSVNHGSGRLLGRERAKRELKAIHDEIDDQMRNIRRVLGGVEVVGIATNTARTPLDECNECYKPLDKVLGVLVDNDIAEVRHRLYPVANLKGADNPRGRRNAAEGTRE